MNEDSEDFSFNIVQAHGLSRALQHVALERGLEERRSGAGETFVDAEGLHVVVGAGDEGNHFLRGFPAQMEYQYMRCGTFL